MTLGLPAACVGAAASGAYLLGPTGGTGTVAVDIPPGAGAAAIGRRLKAAGLIRSAAAFQFAARVMGESESMKAGEYRLPRGLGVLQIIDRLVAGEAEARWVVIPEGSSLEQVARRLEERRVVRARDFLRAARRRPRAYGLQVGVPRHSVDGYLMPDSYKLAARTKPAEAVQLMLRNWNTRVMRPYRRLFSRSDLPVDKIVTVASMIEREARIPEDRPLISSVIRNRLRRKMRLQIDATVLYALGKHKSVVTLRDLEVDSPYNTYRRLGLPPGPICNPGVASILAALQPADTDYLYYVARGDGSHVFSRTAEEHQAAVAEARGPPEPAAPEARR